MKRALLLFMAAGLIIADAAAQPVQYTKRSRNEVREGPGNYFPLLFVLPSGIPVIQLKTDGGWMNIKLKETDQPKWATHANMWMSKNSLSEKAPRKEVAALDLDVTTVRASGTQVAAAVRGFAERYGKAGAQYNTQLDHLERPAFTPWEYEQFKSQSQNPLHTPDQIRLQYAFERFFGEYAPSEEETGIGMGVAARLLGDAALDNPQLNRYVNLVATFVAEGSGMYDVPLRIVIVHDDLPRAFSFPGGYIVLSDEIVRLCSSEAELAAIVAHEVTHIMLRHGMKETRVRKTAIQMDEAMEELEQETGREKSEVEQELEEMSLEAYDIINKPRLLTYESEADKGGALFLARAGYAPMALTAMIEKVGAVAARNVTWESMNPWIGKDYAKRKSDLTQFLTRTLPRFRGVTNEERFQHETQSLR